MYSGETMVLTDLGDGLVEWSFDTHGAPMNSLGAAALKEWAEVLDVLESGAGIKGLLLTSAKSSFIAGANIKEFPTLFSGSAESIWDWARHVQTLCNRLESLPFATVAAIDGAALGGGFELVLSADRRILSPSAVLGLPEVTLGICPGWGGSVRLTRMIGLTPALPWLLEGKSRNAREALEAQVADLVTQSSSLKDTALQSLVALAEKGPSTWNQIRAKKRAPLPHLEEVPESFQKYVIAPGKIPASTILKSVQTHCYLPFDEALALEAECFAMLAKDDDASALIGLFISEQRLKKRVKQLAGGARPIEFGAVVGAGLMGGGIAYQAAINGVPISLRDIKQEALDLGVDTARSILNTAVGKGRMTSEAANEVLHKIHPTQNYDGFDKARLVIEAVVEKYEVKSQVLADIESRIHPDAVLTSNTSTISINALAEGLQRPSQFCGMHFFNPVPVMPLVEVICGAQTSPQAIADTVNFAIDLGKKPIVVQDCPGFLINRILFPYFNAFNRLLLDGVSFEYIDKVMLDFGWPMGPAHLADVIGLDTMVHADRVLQNGYPERMSQPATVIVEQLFAQGFVGKKGGAGFYDYGAGTRLPSAAALALTSFSVSSTPVRDEQIVERLLIPFCTEALRCLDERIVETADDVDLGAVMGLGFPRFRGGPLRYIEALGLEVFASTIRRYAGLGALYEVPEGLAERIINSKNIL